MLSLAVAVSGSLESFRTFSSRVPPAKIWSAERSCSDAFQKPSITAFRVFTGAHSIRLDRLEQRRVSDEFGNRTELLLWHRLCLELLCRLTTI